MGGCKALVVNHPFNRNLHPSGNILGSTTRMDSWRKKAKKRAVFLIPSDRMGGAERVVRTLAECAAKKKTFDLIDVFVLCRDRTGTLDDLEGYGFVNVIYTNATSEIRGLWQLLTYLLNNSFAFVFSSSTHLNSLVSLLRRLRLLRAERVVARESTMIFDRSFGIAGMVFRSFYKLYGGQDLIVCQTERMRDSLDKHTGGKFRNLLCTLPNPIDLERAVQRAPGAPRVAHSSRSVLRIAWCGRLVPVKVPSLAIDVLAYLHAKNLPYEMVVIGDGPERKEIELRAKKLSLNSKVEFTGKVENPCVLMASCDVGLVTSEIEGFPNVVLEMLASGIPKIVTTDCAGGLSDIPGVHVVTDGDAAALASLIVSGQVGDRLKIQSYLDTHSPEGFLSDILGLPKEGVA